MLCLNNSLSGPFEQFSLNFSQGQGHTSMLWDSAAGDLAVLQTAVLFSGKHILRTHIGEIKTSEIIRPSYWIFDMQHHLEDLFKVCSNYVHRNKMPGAGSHISYMLT